jgi:hypothetical protein
MQERTRQVSPSALEIKLTLSSNAQAKLARARELIHSETMAEVFEKAFAEQERRRVLLQWSGP